MFAEEDWPSEASNVWKSTAKTKVSDTKDQSQQHKNDKKESKGKSVKKPNKRNQYQLQNKNSPSKNSHEVKNELNEFHKLPADSKVSISEHQPKECSHVKQGVKEMKRKKPNKRNKYRQLNNTSPPKASVEIESQQPDSQNLVGPHIEIEQKKKKTKKRKRQTAEVNAEIDETKKSSLKVIQKSANNEPTQDDATEGLKPKQKRKKRKAEANSEIDSTKKRSPKIIKNSVNNGPVQADATGGLKTKQNREKLEDDQPTILNETTDRSSTLRQKMLSQLTGGQFRYLNEQLYTISGSEAYEMFKEDEHSFQLYHEGYRSQASKWPINPLNVIIEQVQQLPSSAVIADFGCGDAKLAQMFPKRTIHSFDFVALNPRVTACDMAKVPLKSNCVDLAVFCLSLMGSNLNEYIAQANRVLKYGGSLKIAELESRFDNVSTFVDALKLLGFNLIRKSELNDYFLLFDLKKTANIKKDRQKLPDISLKPCLYKRR